MKLRLKEDPREWQKHLLVMTLIVDAVVALLFLRGRVSSGGFRLVQPLLTMVLVCGIARPVWFRAFYRGGMTANFWAGKIIGRAILTVFFLVAVTPLGLLLRIFGRDLLGIRSKPPGESYWRKSPGASEFDRMF
jgi:hypothetical protein